MLINKKAVRQLCKDQGKQVTQEFILALEQKVRGLISRAVVNVKHFKRLTAAELL